MTAVASTASDSSTKKVDYQRQGNAKLVTYRNYWRIICDLLNRCTKKILLSNYSVTEITVSKSESFTVQYVGDGGQFSYLLGLISDGEPGSVSIHTQQKISLAKLLLRKLPSTNADLSIVDLDFPLQRWLHAPGIHVPHWLKQKISLGDDWDEYLGSMRRKTRREAQRMIRKFDLTTHLVSGADYGATFYDDLYRPYISSRHGDSSVIIDREEFIAKIKLSQIMQLLYQGEVIAAAQVDTSEATLALGWTGVANRDERELRGAADALDYFCLKHAFDSGCSSVDMGHSRPVLSDGILRYKKKWRASVNTGVVPQGSFVFRPNRLSSPCIKFLEDNALLSREKRGLVAHLFVPDCVSNKSDELAHLLKETFIEGLAKILVYSSQSMELPAVEGLCAIEQITYHCGEELRFLTGDSG